jgi:hypothetical protein
MLTWFLTHTDALVTALASVVAVVTVLRVLGYDNARDLKRRDDERAGAVRRSHERTDRILEILCLVALATSCAHRPAASRMVPDRVEVVLPCPVTRPASHQTPCPELPIAPALDWMPMGCPSSFGSCLSGADAMKVRMYLRDVARWSTEVHGGCHAGGR